jgi:hypothetical protein
MHMFAYMLYTNIRLSKNESPCIPQISGRFLLIPVFGLFLNRQRPHNNNKNTHNNNNMALQADPSDLAYLPFSPSICFSIASQWIFDKQAYQWQEDVAGRIIISGNVKQTLHAVLVVRPTGGGKSLLRDIVGIILGGVALTVLPLLSLGADQTSKVHLKSNFSTLYCYTVRALYIILLFF